MKQADIDKLVAPGLHRCDRGLFLQVAGPESRSWIFRYSFMGKPRWLGLGSALDVSLAQARDARDDARALLRQKIDPVQDRKDAKLQARVQERSSVTFRERAEQYLQAHEEGWRSPKHRDQWRATLRNHVYPAIGNMPAAAVTAGHVVDLLRPIWTEKQETARRIRGRIESILDYAADPDDSAYRNPAAATVQLLKKLPKLSKESRRPTSHPALAYDEMAAFTVALKAREGTAALALEFTILTAVRTGEALGARWEEIDRAARLWIVPAERMKGKREQRIPLSKTAIAVLDRAEDVRIGEFVFPSLPHDRPLSNMAMLTVLRRMNRADLTVHGFRATFRTWAAERTNFPREVIEAALAHVLEDKTEAAYQRGDLLEKRRKLMTAWADFCANVDRGDKGESDNVVAIRAS
jgi:integrase